MKLLNEVDLKNNTNPTKEELLESRRKIKSQIWELEKKLKDKAFVSSVDFASMYPNIIRLLNASIESLVGFLDDDPIAYRELGLSKKVKRSKEISKELVNSTLANSKYVKFVGKDEEKISLRREIYNGDFSNASIEEITETPFERYFLACVGLFDANEITMRFQGKQYTVAELNKHFKEMDYSVSGSGAIFKRNLTSEPDKVELGLIPSYLAFLFQERKKVKKEMATHFKHKILLEKFKMAAELDGILS